MSDEVHFRLSSVLLERLDAIAAGWGVSRSGAIRRLIADADVDVARAGLPSMQEMLEVAADRARRGNIAAMNFIANHSPDPEEAEWLELVRRFAGDD